MLKVNQSVSDSWPVLTMEAVGRLMTKALPEPLVEVEILKILPELPVETLLMILTGWLITKLLVEVEMKKESPPVEVETLWIILLTIRLEELKFLLASVTTRVEAVRVARLRLPR